MAPDLRKVIGTSVMCKATHITHITECNRRYGSSAKTKMLDGVVVEVHVERNNPTNRAQTYVTGDWELGNGRTKRVKVNIRFISLKSITINELTPDNNTNNIAPAPSSPEDNNIINDNEANNDEEPVAEVIPEAVIDNPTVDTTLQQLDQLADDSDDETVDVTLDIIPVIQPPPTPPTLPVITVNDIDLPCTMAHDRLWYPYRHSIGSSINGMVPYREWGVRLPTGGVWREGCNSDETISRLDVFLQMFPVRQLNDMMLFTNQQLRKKNYRDTTKTEILKFLGVLILCTRYEWNNRSDLWAETANSKYEMAPQLGKKTGLKRRRFDELWSTMRWSAQPEEKPEMLSLETYRWMLCDGFIRNFNNLRATNFVPSERICVDESFSRWYGAGGNWINAGLPMYVSMDRKPEDGCEIQDAACGRTGVMIRLKLVKSSREDHHDDEEVDGTLNHGTKILLKLVQPWFNTDRVICADSYFASVQTAKELLRVGLKFIGVVKTATREYPTTLLQGKEMGERGDRYGVLSKDDNDNFAYLAFVWLDRDRRYFIATTSSLQEGQPQIRDRWRQLVNDLTTPPEKVEIVVTQPVASEIYYDCCAKIDNHNRDRQATLQMERKFKTHDWSMRVNMSIFAICVVDAWRVWTRINASEGERQSETQKVFYGHLSAELIDNVYDRIGSGTRRVASVEDDNETNLDPELVDPLTGLARPGDGVYLRKSAKRRKNSNHVHQGRCLVCKTKSSYLCSACCDNDSDVRQPWICNTETGRMCFATHRMAKHND
jgi:hypothetical protein